MSLCGYTEGSTRSSAHVHVRYSVMRGRWHLFVALTVKQKLDEASAAALCGSGSDRTLRALRIVRAELSLHWLRVQRMCSVASQRLVLATPQA